MKFTPKNILKILLVCIAIILKIAISNIFNLIPLFLLKWPTIINIILIVLFSCSVLRYEEHKINSFFKSVSIINIPLNIVIWIIALISMIKNTLDCSPVVFYILFGINAFLIINKTSTILNEGNDKEA